MCTTQWLLVHSLIYVTVHFRTSSPQKEDPPTPLSMVTSHPLVPAQQPRIYFWSLWSCLFWTLHINGIIRWVVSGDWLRAWILVLRRRLHIGRALLLRSVLLPDCPWDGWTIYQTMERHAGYFSSLAPLPHAALNTVRKFSCGRVLSFLLLLFLGGALLHSVEKWSEQLPYFAFLPPAGCGPPARTSRYTWLFCGYLAWQGLPGRLVCISLKLVMSGVFVCGYWWPSVSL